MSREPRPPAARISGLTVSPIRLISEGGPAEKIPLGLGEPTWPLPEPGRRALAEYSGVTGYGPQQGLPELRRSVAALYAAGPGETTGPDNVIITIGCQEALFSLLLGWVDPGDKVLVPDPGFVAYPALTRLAGGEPVPYPLDAGNRFRVAAQAVIERLDAPGLRAVVVNHPGNPTSTGASPEALRQIADACRERDVLLISDEVYRDLYFGARPPSLRDVSDWGAVVSSVSKGWGAPGLRVGWIVAGERWLAAARVMHGYATTSAAKPAQLAARALIDASETVLAEAREELYARWNALRTAWAEHLGETLEPPDGAFYAFLPLPESAWADPMAFCLQLRDETGVVLIPGIVFGEAGRRHVRLSFAAAPEQIAEGIKRLAPYWRGAG
jgi:aspartate/methionine/tyrosine aminotransferase